MNKLIICVIYSSTPGGQTALGMAASLVKLLHADQLVTYLWSDPGAALQAMASDSRPPQQKANVLEAVCRSTGLPPENIKIECRPVGSRLDFPPGAIVVEQRLASARNQVHVLAPFDEQSLTRGGNGPFLIPFGDGESGLYAASVGLPLASQLGRTVVFYHTTWRNKSIASERPEDHMCAKAQELRRAIEEQSATAGVKFLTLVETAEDVVEGMVRCALRESASLIVTTRGLRIGLGSYVNQILDQSPLPVLVAGR